MNWKIRTNEEVEKRCRKTRFIRLLKGTRIRWIRHVEIEKVYLDKQRDGYLKIPGQVVMMVICFHGNIPI